MSQIDYSDGATIRYTYDAAGNRLSEVVDTAAPSVAIEGPTDTGAYTTSAAVLDLSGNAADDSGVAEITWTNNRGGSGAAVGLSNWAVEGIPLQAGLNILTVVATDIVGKTATGTLTVSLVVSTPAETPPEYTTPTATESGTPALTATATPAATEINPGTLTPTTVVATITAIPTLVPSETATATRSLTPTETSTVVASPTGTTTASATVTMNSPTFTAVTPTATAVPTETQGPTNANVCIGDCNLDGARKASELARINAMFLNCPCSPPLIGANASGCETLLPCVAADVDGNQCITAGEKAQLNASILQNGAACPIVPATPTP